MWKTPKPKKYLREKIQPEYEKTKAKNICNKNNTALSSLFPQK